MTIQRRFAPIGGRFESESVAGFIGIYTPGPRGANGQRKSLDFGQSV